jgi:hypothetical protein
MRGRGRARVLAAIAGPIHTRCTAESPGTRRTEIDQDGAVVIRGLPPCSAAERHDRVLANAAGAGSPKSLAPLAQGEPKAVLH